MGTRSWILSHADRAGGRIGSSPSRNRQAPGPPLASLCLTDPVNLYLRLLALMLRVRRAPRIDLWGQSRTPFRVWPNDLDVFRHMNNARYLALLDLGRTDLMARSGFDRTIAERGWYPVVGAQTITYKRSLKLWQRFVVTTRVLGFDERAVYMEQEFRRGGELYARAVVQARFLRRAGGTVQTADVLEAAGGAPEGRENLPAWVADWAAAVRIPSSEA